MAQGWIDRVIFLPVSGGTGDFVVSSAVQGYNTPAQSNAATGTLYHYAAELRNAANNITDWEVGTGAYTVSTTSLARTTVEFSSNGNAKVNFSSPPNVMITALAADFQAGGRTLLTGSTSYYVSPSTGNDANNGSLANPWQTLTHAAAFLQNSIDFNGQRVDLILLTTDTYPGPSTGMGGFLGGGILSIHGNTSTSANFVCTSTGVAGGEVFDINVDTATQIRFDQLTLKPSTSTDAIRVRCRVLVYVAGAFGDGLAGSINLDFSANGTNMTGFLAENGAILNVFGANNITVNTAGSVRQFYACFGQDDNSPGNAYINTFADWTMNGNLAVTRWLLSEYNGVLVFGDSFVGGTVTGKRFQAQFGGVILGVDETFGPGDTLGTVEALGMLPDIAIGLTPCVVIGSAAAIDAKIAVNLNQPITAAGGSLTYVDVNDASTMANNVGGGLALWYGNKQNIVGSGSGDYTLIHGTDSVVTYSGTGSLASELGGVLCQALASGSGTVNEVIGGQFTAAAGSAAGGNVVLMEGGIFSVSMGDKANLSGSMAAGKFTFSTANNGGAAKTVAAAYTILANAPGIAGSNTITNAYGLYIGDHSGIGATDSFNLLSKGAAGINKIEGRLAFGTGTASTVDGTLWYDGTELKFRRSGATIAVTPGFMLNVEDQTLSGGANITAKSLSTGNITVDCGARPLQFITNGGAFTITAPVNDGQCLLLITNNASAGTITFSGFTVGSSVGDALDTTNTHKFTISIWRINSVAGYRVAAHQ